MSVMSYFLLLEIAVLDLNHEAEIFFVLLNGSCDGDIYNILESKGKVHD